MEYGLDLLGLPKFGRAALESFPQGFALGVFAEEFGDSREITQALLRTGKVTRLRVQLIWDPSHNYGDQHLAKLRELTPKWERIAATSSVPVELSPFCEHKLPDCDKYLDLVKQLAPSCEPVSSIAGGIPSRRYKNEIHGKKAGALYGRYNFSFDGDSAVDSDMRLVSHNHRTCSTFYLWTSQFNGKARDDEKTPVNERKFWPSPELIKSVAYLATRQGRARLPDKYLWKTHSEQHNVPASPRELKPVLIAPIKADHAELRTKDALIAKLPYYQPYVDGRHRYYAGIWGYELAEKAKKASKLPACELWISGKRIGVVNPAFREGEFR